MKLKYLVIVIFCFFTNITFAQSKKVKLPPNWYNLDLIEDGYFGISTEKAYKELLVNLQPKQKVIVAVIDGGVDINHEDLKDILWTNTKEIAGNGIDDDGNGFIDDVHGWNFIGSKAGNLEFDNLELTRIRRKLIKYISTTNLTVLDSTQKEEYALYQRVTREFGEKYDNAHAAFGFISTVTKILDSVALVNSKSIPSADDIERYKADSDEEGYYVKYIKNGIKENGSVEKFYKEMKDAYKQYDVMLKYNLNMKYDLRQELVGDNYSDAKERIYGNNDVVGPNADHGSHVSGIIAANRNNSLGINGIANNVSVMAIRVVPEGDERDKDVANGIRYAVDNGAKIVNMSFGKGFKWNKEIVDDAVRYAEEHGVLLIHAAGNDNENIDVKENYPNKYFDTPEAIAYAKESRRKSVEALKDLLKPGSGQMQGQMQRPEMRNQSSAFKKAQIDTAKFNLPHANNWIEVGASTYANDSELKASFSNYGKYSVDVFAPGFMINSTVPGSKYEEFDGTSMAAPVVSGLSALLLSYYPDLKPYQVREIIMKSVTKVQQKVKYKNEKNETVRSSFSDISISGGIVNAYNALKMAASYSVK
ncbi:S8 family peptidase [Pedobacter psychroterrae]|uniref:Peptidase S8 n=1 Tax=Pedobacter psychroterrae TaxID=2530453 RepID=A0A4R0NCB4_9SPHI|nr:S8 family peptidase [Pedobacter psychroterrae]TCC97969.1 peptidase S8 [Pedobacter psychroterrae]